jgi:hypothetical protein
MLHQVKKTLGVNFKFSSCTATSDAAAALILLAVLCNARTMSSIGQHDMDIIWNFRGRGLPALPL